MTIGKLAVMKTRYFAIFRMLEIAGGLGKVSGGHGTPCPYLNGVGFYPAEFKIGHKAAVAGCPHFVPNTLKERRK